MHSSLDLDGLRFNVDGLIPAIVQEANTAADGIPAGRVLMMAWLNREALAATLDTGFMHYWSRSRGKLWFKGESSGHRQEVVHWYRDCDGDTLLFTVRQQGGAGSAYWRAPPVTRGPAFKNCSTRTRTGTVARFCSNLPRTASRSAAIRFWAAGPPPFLRAAAGP